MLRDDPASIACGPGAVGDTGLTQKRVAEEFRDPFLNLACPVRPSSGTGRKSFRPNYFAIASTSSAAFRMMSRIR